MATKSVDHATPEYLSTFLETELVRRLTVSLAVIGKLLRRTAIGLDIGGGGMRAVQLSRSGRTVSITGMVQRVYPSSPDSGEIASVACIRDVARHDSFRGRRVVTALNPPDVEFHPLQLPPGVFSDKASEVSEVVRWEMERLVSTSIEDVQTQYWVLPKSQKDASTAMGVAVRRKTVLATLDSIADAGLFCTCVDAGATALARFGILLKEWGPDDVWGVLDLGIEESRVILCVDNVPVLVRRAGGGGRAWTQRVASSLQLSEKAAEVQKRDHGIAPTVDGDRGGAQSSRKSEVGAILSRALRPELRELASELKRSYEYILSCYPSGHATDLILVGGGASTRNLPEFLSEALGIPVRRASQFLSERSSRLRCEGDARGALESLALSVGLAVST